MKQNIKNLIKITLVTFLIFSTSACKKDDNNEGEVGTSDSEFSARIDGEQFETSYILAFQLTASKMITITAETSEKEQIQLLIPGNITPGTHAINDLLTQPYVLGSYSPLNTEDYFEALTSGTINITTYDTATTTIKGTFSCQTQNVTITEGVFDLVYKEL